MFKTQKESSQRQAHRLALMRRNLGGEADFVCQRRVLKVRVRLVVIQNAIEEMVHLIAEGVVRNVAAVG